MKTKKKLGLVIFVLLLLVILSSGLSFSRYSSTICNTGDESTVIIVNKYNLKALWDTSPTQLQYPGMSTQTYDFTLKNEHADGTGVTTEDLAYTVTVSMNWDSSTPVVGLNVPLKMKLYIVEDGGTRLVAPPASMGAGVNRIGTQSAVISGGESIDFRLEWDWGTSIADRDYRYANKKIDVKIDVKAEQIIQ